MNVLRKSECNPCLYVEEGQLNAEWSSGLHMSVGPEDTGGIPGPVEYRRGPCLGAGGTYSLVGQSFQKVRLLESE